MSERMPMRAVKEAAQGRISAVLAEIGIGMPARGRSIVMCNPLRGEARPSLQIWVKPGFEGAWKDHGADIKGDIIDLVAYFKGWSNGGDRAGRAKAAAFIAHVLGLETMSARDFDAMRRENAARAKAQAERTADDDAYKRSTSFSMWLNAKTILPGDPPWRYFGFRGCDMAKLARPPSALRWFASHQHLESQTHHPCIIAKMQFGDGSHAAVHRTWIERNGLGKAEVTPARKIWPTFAGSYIPIARGASGLPVKDADKNGIADELVLAEGIEKALALAVSDPGPRVWAFGALPNLAHVPVPDCATSIIVAADRDAGNPRARAMLEKGVAYLKGFGRPVAVVYPATGNDVDEFLRGED